MNRRIAILGVSAMLMLPATAAFAQRFLFGDGTGYEPPSNNIPYDGRFTFARIKFAPCCGGIAYYYRGLPPWAHGYVPDVRRRGSRGEVNLMKILNEVTYLNPHVEETNVFRLDDPNLFKFPVAYMTEAGYWELSDKEAAGLRAYLKKGGFIIAIGAQAPIVPVIIHGAFEVQTRRAFRINPGDIQISYKAPIATTGLTLADRDALIARVRGVFEAELAKTPLR